MRTMHECQLVDMAYFDCAPHSYRAAVEIAASAEQIFSCFEDEHSWPAWAMPIKKVDWTCAKPYAIGSTRRVAMMGGLIGDEVFIAWDYPKRMAFCFTHSSQN